MPPCPKCGGRKWLARAGALEAQFVIDEGEVTRVRIMSPYPMDSELDPVCQGCGEQLLDWSSPSGDAAWLAHHEARRPAWDEFNRTVMAMEVPLPPVVIWEPGWLDDEEETDHAHR